ncbi:MAG: hypothetical protein L6Q57_08500, partial [Alphaproteobacteria bacterium]|nr:hypothetical protein [Alphaproteobacteria bacterium]
YMLRAERYPSTERGQQGHEQLVTFTSVETYRISGAALAKLASDFPHSCQLGSLKEVNCDPHSLDSHLPLVSMVYDENTRSHTKNYDDATIRALAETLCGDEIADLKAHGYSLDSQSLAWMVNEADYDRASLRGMASALSVKRDANGDVEHYGVEWPFYPGEYRPHIVYLDAKGQWFSQSWPDGLTSLLREMNPETGMFSAIQVRLPRENEAEEVRANKEGEIPADLASFATNPFHGLFLPEKVVRIMAPAVARPDDPAPR